MFAKAHFESTEEALGELRLILRGRRNSQELNMSDAHTNCILTVGVADVVGIGNPQEGFGTYNPSRL
jgi:hypothetical protein